MEEMSWMKERAKTANTRKKRKGKDETKAGLQQKSKKIQRKKPGDETNILVKSLIRAPNFSFLPELSLIPVQFRTCPVCLLPGWCTCSVACMYVCMCVCVWYRASNKHNTLTLITLLMPAQPPRYSYLSSFLSSITFLSLFSLIPLLLTLTARSHR